MNIFGEKFNKKYSGFYRGKILKIDEDKKNGIYKVCIYPMFANLEEDKIPSALSNMTNKESENPLLVDDWVWCFFDNGNPRLPIIFDRCNIKDQYPDYTKGEEPDWWADLEKNDDIEETEIEYAAEYGKSRAFYFGENIKICFDEENEQIIVKTSKAHIAIDADGGLHLKGSKVFLVSEGDLNITGTKSILVFGENKIEFADDGIILNENFKVLNT